MKRLLPVLMGFVVLLLSSTEGWSAEPDKDQLCLLGTEHSHSAVLGKCSDAYETGNYETALRDWGTLAKEGNSSAQFNLGQIYLRGQGVPKDYKTAGKWYTLAAEQGDAGAQSNLGLMYDNGEGVPENDKTAVKWFTLAAEQGFVFAQFNLGAMYAEGNGVIQDYVRAHMWWNIAASQGDNVATKNKDIVAKEMTPSQLEKTQELARECVRKKYKGC